MELDDVNVGKLCTKAKRIWNQNKLKRVKTDELSKLEAAEVSIDAKLAEMVHQKEQLEKEIVQHIDDTLAKNRDSKYRHEDVFNILKDCLQELYLTNGLYVADNKDFKDVWQLDNFELAERILAVMGE